MIIMKKQKKVNIIFAITMLLFLLIIFEGCKKESPRYCYVVAPRGVNLRNEANIKSKVITLLPYKARLVRLSDKIINEVIEDLGGSWINVSYNNRKGWVFNPYISEEIPKASTPDSLKALNSTIRNLTSNKVKINNKYFEFGLSPEEILKEFGNPNEISNGSGFGYFAYNSCFICFDDFFAGKTLKDYKIRSYKHDYKTEGLFLFPKINISLDDLVAMQNKKLTVFYNSHDGRWETSFNKNKYDLRFQLNHLDSYIETIILRKEKEKD